MEDDRDHFSHGCKQCLDPLASVEIDWWFIASSIVHLIIPYKAFINTSSPKQWSEHWYSVHTVGMDHHGSWKYRASLQNKYLAPSCGCSRFWRRQWMFTTSDSPATQWKAKADLELILSARKWWLRADHLCVGLTPAVGFSWALLDALSLTPCWTRPAVRLQCPEPGKPSILHSWAECLLGASVTAERVLAAFISRWSKI